MHVYNLVGQKSLRQNHIYPKYTRKETEYSLIKTAHGPLARYAKLQVAHAPGMPGTFFPAADLKGNR